MSVLYEMIRATFAFRNRMLWCVGSAMVIVNSVCIAEDQGTIRVERLFLNQLLNREFFDVARHHCETQQQRATTDDDKAQWQFRLTEISEQQAWFSEAANRNGLLSHAAQQITEFLATNQPSMENEFLLRIQQARLLVQSVRMTLMVEEGGKLFARDAVVRRSVKPPAPSNPRLLETLDKTIELIVALQSQLNELRRHLDPQLARLIRDSGRLEHAECLLLKWRILNERSDAKAATLQTEAVIAIEAALRASRDEATKSRCRLLLAEAGLVNADQQAFRLRIKAVEPSRESAFLPEYLTVRSHLFRQEASQGEKLLASAVPLSRLQIQHATWLSLECALGARELAGELQNAVLIKQASDDFTVKLKSAEKNLTGVFREASERTADRFALVSEVGVEVADLVEQVELMRADDDARAALRLIQQALAKLPPDARRPRAALQLRAGEIHLAGRDWQAASKSLLRARELFGQLQMLAEQSAADLLHIYAVGQQIGAGSPITAVDYERLLDEHLTRFPKQQTANRAREWLLQAIGSKNPNRSASIALELYRSETNPRNIVEALQRIGELLQAHDAMANVSAKATLTNEFLAEVSKLQQAPQLYPPDDLVVLRIQKLEFTISNAIGKTDRLKSVSEELASLEQDLLLAGQLDETEIARLQGRLDLLRSITVARSTSTISQMQTTEQRLIATPDERLVQVSGFLGQQYQSATVQPGDVWLAQVNTHLLSRLLPTASLPMLIQQLGIVQRTSELTEDSFLMDGWMKRLLSQQLSEEQVKNIAAALSETRSGQQIRNSTVLARFWNRVATSHSSGSDLWLESQLQLASLSLESDDKSAAKKRLGVVSAIYPGWGSTQRLERVQAILRSMSELP